MGARYGMGFLAVNILCLFRLTSFLVREVVMVKPLQLAVDFGVLIEYMMI